MSAEASLPTSTLISELKSRSLQDPRHLFEAIEMPIADPMKNFKKYPSPIRYPQIVLSLRDMSFSRVDNEDN
jgi:hypothetical protein